MRKSEYAKLTAEQSALNVEYQKLKTDVNKVGKICSNAYSVLGAEQKQERHLQGEVTNVVRNAPATEKPPTNMQDRLKWAKRQADEYNAGRERTRPPKPKLHQDRGGR